MSTAETTAAMPPRSDTTTEVALPFAVLHGEGQGAAPRKPEPPTPDLGEEKTAVGAPAPRPVLSPVESPLTLELEAKIRRALAAEKRRDGELSRMRVELAEASDAFRQELDKLRAVERKRQQRRERLEALLSSTRSMEEDRNAARQARTALEALRNYYRLP